MILAGVKIVTGYELRPNSIGHTDGSISFVKHYLQVGEYLFQYVCDRASKSNSFKKVNWLEMSQSFNTNFLGGTMKMLEDFQSSFAKATATADAENSGDLPTTFNTKNIQQHDLD